jgi:hypothetical protein
MGEILRSENQTCRTPWRINNITFSVETGSDRERTRAHRFILSLVKQTQLEFVLIH